MAKHSPSYTQRKWTVYLKDASQTHVEVISEDYELQESGGLEFSDVHPKPSLVMLFAPGSWSYCVAGEEVPAPETNG